MVVKVSPNTYYKNVHNHFTISRIKNNYSRSPLATCHSHTTHPHSSSPPVISGRLTDLAAPRSRQLIVQRSSTSISAVIGRAAEHVTNLDHLEIFSL
ncbi:hypothetical protein J6590_004759 [Homalodisca vitripennis]|nr:hypothetical protein J6590_004759 [Homalodisca vitripennis]